MRGLAVEGDDAPVGDGDAVGVVGQIGEHLLGTPEGRLGIGVPVGLVRAGDQEVEGLSVGHDFSGNLQRAVGIGLANGSAEECAERLGRAP